MYTGCWTRVIIVLKSVNDTYFQRTARRVAPATEPLYVGCRQRWVDSFSPRPRNPMYPLNP